jgi:nucleotide-binding universal stress UspA family protein
MRRILLPTDGGAGCRDALGWAIGLCGATGASLTVVHPAVAASGAVLGDMMVLIDRPADGEARAAFDAVCGGRDDARFLAYQASGGDIVATLGPGYDLILVERMQREAGPEADLLNAALFESGRPVLLLPPGLPALPFVRPVLAWNGTAMNARAIHSALPLLAQACRAVLLIGSGAGRANADALLEYLQAAGLAAEVRSYASERLTARGRGRALIAAARSLDADLLVTGAFGESAAGSLFGLGRATRKLVTAAPMPLLLQN